MHEDCRVDGFPVKAYLCSFQESSHLGKSRFGAMPISALEKTRRPKTL